MTRARQQAAPLPFLVFLAGCVAVSPSPTVLPSAEPSTVASPSTAPSGTPLPTATPLPGLRLPEPEAFDFREISYAVSVELQAGESGRIVIRVENRTDTMIDELVLRWPTEVRDTIFLAPFEPSLQRIREGGDPLVQDWTKWVDGPGEHGEPAGTTSLGWGPLLPGATLTIPVVATRVAPGPLLFDLQILAGEAVLTSDGEPAWFQVSVP